MVDLIKVAEEAFATGKEFPAFRPGDTITVAYKIVEGNKERIQMFRGIVIKISGHLSQRRGAYLPYQFSEHREHRSKQTW